MHGDQASANLLVKTLTPMVMATIRRLLPRSQSADWEDVQQDTFLRMIKSLHKFKNDFKICLWVMNLAIWCSTDRLRLDQRLRRLGKLSDEMETAVDPKTPPLSDRVEKCIELTLDQLPDDLRRTYELHVKQGLTIVKTAKIMKVAEGTIYNRMKRIEPLLLACLDWSG